MSRPAHAGADWESSSSRGSSSKRAPKVTASCGSKRGRSSQKRFRFLQPWALPAVDLLVIIRWTILIRYSWRKSCERAAELILDMNPDDLVERLLRRKAELGRPLCIEIARPALDDLGDHRLGP